MGDALVLDLRHRLQSGLLRHLVTVAEDAGTEAPAVAGKFRLPNSNGTHVAFRPGASEMLDDGRANRDLLVKHGLSETMLEELEAAIKEFDASLQDCGSAATVGRGPLLRARLPSTHLGDHWSGRLEVIPQLDDP